MAAPEEPRMEDRDDEDRNDDELEQDGVGGPAKPKVERQARLAKKAESARLARQRHKGKVENAQATLRELRLKAAELQSRRSSEEARYFGTLLDEIEDALPPERRAIFAGWVAEARERSQRTPQLGASADLWEPELALFALSASPRLTGVNAELPFSAYSSPALSATESPMLSAKMSAFALNSLQPSPLSGPSANSAPSPLTLGASTAPPLASAPSARAVEEGSEGDAAAGVASPSSGAGSEASPAAPSLAPAGEHSAVAGSDAVAASNGALAGSHAPQSLSRMSPEKLTGVVSEVKLPPIGANLRVGSVELECAMGIIDLAVRSERSGAL